MCADIQILQMEEDFVSVEFQSSNCTNDADQYHQEEYEPHSDSSIVEDQETDEDESDSPVEVWILLPE